MSTFWSIWVIVITVAMLVGCVWLLMSNRKTAVSGDHEDGEPATTGHTYDGIEEYDNPLPAWWFWKFVGTVVFAVIYLILYPGLGNFKGVLDWSQEKQWQESVDQANAELAESFANYAATSIDDLAGDPAALRMGRRLFNNNCSVCHGVGGTGGYGFPDLSDNDWLYGGKPEEILTSIANGRRGAMPAWGNALGDEGVTNVSEFVLSLSGQSHDVAKAESGKANFGTFCASCHGADGKGMHALGAPDLTDDIWLYKQESLSLAENIRHSVRFGREGVMPNHDNKLREEKIHLIAAYVYSLSQANQ